MVAAMCFSVDSLDCSFSLKNSDEYQVSKRFTSNAFHQMIETV